MLLLHPVLTCTDAASDFAPCAWFSPAATYDGGVSPSAVGTKTPLTPAVVSPIATCTSGVYFPPTGADIGLTLSQLAQHGGYLYSNIYNINRKSCTGDQIEIMLRSNVNDGITFVIVSIKICMFEYVMALFLYPVHVRYAERRECSSPAIL